MKVENRPKRLFKDFIKLKVNILLERIADGKVEGEAILELGYVVVTPAARLVRCVDADAKIAANHQHTDVHSEANAGACCEVTQEGGTFQQSSRSRRILLE